MLLICFFFLLQRRLDDAPIGVGAQPALLDVDEAREEPQEGQG